MKSLILTIAKGLVEKPDEVTVEEVNSQEKDAIVYRLHVANDDMGRVIGKQGKIAEAIRMVVRSAATMRRIKKRILVEIG